MTKKVNKQSHMRKMASALPDRKSAPKRTGKRLPVPEDPEDRQLPDDPEFREPDAPETRDEELLETPAAPKRGKKQATFPVMEDKRLEDLEEAAIAYAAVRDERQALTRREVDAKDILHTLMKRHEKQIYRVEEMEIKIVSKEETVKVKILKDKDGE